MHLLGGVLTQSGKIYSIQVIDNDLFYSVIDTNDSSYYTNYNISTSITDFYAFTGSTLALNGKIYTIRLTIPGSTHILLEFDPDNNTINTHLLGTEYSSVKWLHLVLGQNGKLYAIGECSIDDIYVLEINTHTGS